MGDMADMAIEQGFQMMLDGGEEPFVLAPRIPRRKSCKYCGMMGLHWMQFRELWRLVDKEGEQHTCQEYREHEDNRSKP